MKHSAIAFGFFTLVLSTSTVASDAEVAAIREQLTEIADMSAADRPTAEMTKEYMRYFADEPTLLPASGAEITGRDAIAEFYKNAFDGIRILSNKYEQPVIVVNGLMATRRYIGTAVFRLPDEEEPLTAKNRYLDVLVKEGDEWKMLWHSWVPVTWE